MISGKQRVFVNFALAIQQVQRKRLRKLAQSTISSSTRPLPKRHNGVLPKCLGNITAMISETHPYASADCGNVVWKGILMEFGRNIQLMRNIDISSNRLSGTIPENITSLPKLMSPNLSRNNLTGSIPRSFGRLSHFESLDLSRNQLSGTIPTSFSSLNFLGKLDLSCNNLTGRIPSSTQLRGFDASAYMENLQLCGPPLTEHCPGDETDEDPGVTDGDENDENKVGSDDELVTSGLYVSIRIGFFCGILGSFWFFNPQKLLEIRLLPLLG